MTFQLSTFVFQILNFLVLAFVLHRLLYRPLSEAVDRRRQAHAQAQLEVERARAEVQSLESQLQSERSALDQSREEILRQAHEQIEAERQKLRGDAEQAIARRQAEARAVIERERNDMLREVRDDVIHGAVDLSRRLLQEAADLQLHEQLIRRLAETLKRIPPAEREALSRGWRPQDGAVLQTATDTNSELVGRIAQAVSELIARPVDLKVQPDASLIAGARLRVAGMVWDASLSGQLTDHWPAQINAEGAHV